MNTNFFLQIFVVLVGAGLLVGALRTLVSKKYLAPYVPTRKKDFEAINRLANLKKGEVFYDLGCGDGRLCRYIAGKNPEARVVGIEILLPLYIWSRGVGILKSRKNLSYIKGNALNKNLSGADVIYLFGRPETMSEEFKNKTKELKSGARIISYAFKAPFESRKKTKGASGTPIYLHKR